MAYIPQHLKEMNRLIVYKLLQQKNNLSKAEISRLTGISVPTVMKIIDYFKELGFVEEYGQGESLLGRKPHILNYIPYIAYAIGVEFAGIELKIGIVDFAGNICYIEKKSVLPDFNTIMSQELAKDIEEVINRSGISREKIKGTCIGAPGVVNVKQQTIALAPLVGVTEVMNYSNFVETLSNRLKMPVIIENDANAAAIGEFVCRGLGLNDDLLFMILGKGIGAGIILNGQLRMGNNYSAGEIGYMIFDKEFVVSKQQSGWLEQNLCLDELRCNSINTEALDVIAGNVALAIINICVPLEISHAIFGRLKDDDFDKMFVQRINKYLHALSVLNLECQLSQCKEPCIVGCANFVIEPIIHNLFSK